MITASIAAGLRAATGRQDPFWSTVFDVTIVAIAVLANGRPGGVGLQRVLVWSNVAPSRLIRAKCGCPLQDAFLERSTARAEIQMPEIA